MTSSTILTSPLSKYLVQYVVPLPERRATTSERVIGARVLTSSEGYEILGKKKEEEERKIKEWLEKNIERDELANRKTEKISKKVEKKSKKAQETSKKAVRTKRKPKTSTRMTSLRIHHHIPQSQL